VVVPAEASLTTKSLSPTTGERVTTHREGLLGGVIRGVAAERVEEEEVRGEIYVLMTGLVGWRGNICTGMTGGSCSRQRWKRNKDRKFFEHPLLLDTPSVAGYLVSLPLIHHCCHNTLTFTLLEVNGCPCHPRPSQCLDQKTGSVQKWWQSCPLMLTDQTTHHLLTLALFTPLECVPKKGLQPRHLLERHWSKRKAIKRCALSMTGSSIVVKLKARRRMKTKRLVMKGTTRALPDLHLLLRQARDLASPQPPPLRCLHPLPLVAQLLSPQTTGRHLQRLVLQP